MSQDMEVSVVIPVFNNGDRLREVLVGLENQEYPRDRFEVIVVDNGSTDNSPEVARSFQGVCLLKETAHSQSPYSTRNRGIESSQGKIIVFLDSTCVPETYWLAEGVRTLEGEDADLVGGNIEFEFSESVTAGEMLDSLINVKMKRAVEGRQVAKGGNLMVRRRVIDEIGMFPEGVRSGADVRWTREAVESEFTLVYGSDMTVRYPARPLGSLLRKQWRVAKQQPVIWEEQGKGASFLRILKGVLKPPSLQGIRKEIENRGKEFMKNSILEIWTYKYIVKFTMFWGRLYGKLKKTFKHLYKYEFESL